MTPVMREVRIIIECCSRKVMRAVEKLIKYAKEHPWEFWITVAIGVVGITILVAFPAAGFAAAGPVYGKCLDLFRIDDF